MVKNAIPPTRITAQINIIRRTLASVESCPDASEERGRALGADRLEQAEQFLGRHMSVARVELALQPHEYACRIV
jgi:hypothetical protein